MSDQQNNKQEKISFRAGYNKDNGGEVRLNAHGKESVKSSKIIIIVIAIIIGVVILGICVSAVVENVIKQGNTSNETDDDDNETPTTEISVIESEPITETQPIESRSEGFLDGISKIEKELKESIATKESDKYSLEDGELLQNVSEREKEYGDNISFEELNKNIKDRESVAKHTHNSRLYFLLGKDYQRLADNTYSNDRDLNQVDCLQKSNSYYIKSLEYFDLSFLVCEDENMRISRSTIFKYLSQNYMNLGNIDKRFSYKHYRYSLVANCLHKEYYNDEKGYATLEVDDNNWNYTQGLIYLDIYEKYPYEEYPNESEEDLKYLYDKCVESYLNVDESSQDYYQANSDLNYFTNMYGNLYEY